MTLPMVYVKAKTPNKLILEMDKMNDTLGGKPIWRDIQFADGLWYAWAEPEGRRPAGGY